MPEAQMKKLEKATFAGGCFWCTEAIFKKLKGVVSVVSGFSGGQAENLTYKDLIFGNSGHAESIQATFDPSLISYGELLEVFWALHDPTTPNRQGADVGPQYRSIILYHNDQQKIIAENSKQELTESGKYQSPIVTEILPLRNFYPAEEYHQNFYEKNPDAPYCRVVIDPKIRKLYKEFKDKIK